MKNADRIDLDGLFRRGLEVGAPWDLVERQMKRLGELKRRTNSGHPTNQELDEYLNEMRQEFMSASRH